MVPEVPTVDPGLVLADYLDRVVDRLAEDVRCQPDEEALHGILDFLQGLAMTAAGLRALADGDGDTARRLFERAHTLLSSVDTRDVEL